MKSVVILPTARIEINHLEKEVVNAPENAQRRQDMNLEILLTFSNDHAFKLKQTTYSCITSTAEA